MLFSLLAAINLAAIWSIVSARRSAETAALEDLRLRTLAQARSLEALLASRRGDFVFLSQSAPLANFFSSLSEKDPMARRWRRLDLEGTMLLFLNARPEVERITVRGPQERALLAAGRRDGAPVLLPTDLLPPPDPGERWLAGTWPVNASAGVAGSMQVILRLENLLSQVVPETESKLILQTDAAPSEVPLPGEEGELLQVAVPVREPGWNPPIHWTLVRRQDQSTLLDSVSALALRYRTTVVLNFAVISLALVMGLVALHQVRRSSVLEAERAQERKVRQLELQVMHSERLASVGRLAAGIAHEINNPLEGMGNYLTLLEEDLKEGRIPEASQLVSKLRQGLDRAAGIIHQVLNFSDPANAPKELLDLNETLTDTVDFARSHPSFRSCRLELRLPPQAVHLSGNRVMLGQLFLNLLINASQAQDGTGEIEVTCDKENGQAIVSVADRGPGIPEEALLRIFEPFYSSHGSTGLGLSVCHRIVSDHGGQIHAANRPDGGAIFRMEFPVEHNRLPTVRT